MRTALAVKCTHVEQHDNRQLIQSKYSQRIHYALLWFDLIEITLNINQVGEISCETT